MKLTIKGRIPSKKNSVIISTRGGRVMKFPSKAYKEWHEDATNQLWGKIPKEPIKGARITIAIYAPDKRSADLTNKAESIMDLLVDNKIIEDDNWYVCSEILLMFGGVDKENPRAVVAIDEVIPFYRVSGRIEKLLQDEYS